MTRIDLHTHSTASDGTDAPSELIRLAAAADLDVVALTDHDTTAGWGEAATAAESLGVTLVPGMELTTQVDGAIVHLLGYLFDPDDEALTAELNRIRADRASRAERMVNRIAVDYALEWDEVLSQAAPGATIGRPHIADALIARGHVADRPEAFADILNTDSPYYVEHYAPTPLEGVRLIREAGGVSVLAHPATNQRARAVDTPYLGGLVTAGLFGVEVNHRENTDAGKKWLRREAKVHDLVQTGASDYHGAGKPNQLGENLTDLEAFERIVQGARAHSLFV